MWGFASRATVAVSRRAVQRQSQSPGPHPPQAADAGAVPSALFRQPVEGGTGDVLALQALGGERFLRQRPQRLVELRRLVGTGADAHRLLDAAEEPARTGRDAAGSGQL